MRAYVLENSGQPESLAWKEMEMPSIRPDEVLVKTGSIGVNYIDLLIRRGIYPTATPPPAIIPGEISGIVTEVGMQVKNLQKGDRVTAFASHGYAEYVAIPATQATIIPEGLSLSEGMLMQAATARHLLDQAEGYQSVIITAAAGGVGSMALQLANLLGVKTIIGMVGSPEKAAYIKSLGASHSINYNDHDWTEQLQHITGDAGVDLILDAIGGLFGAMLAEHLSFGGTMVVYGGTAGQPTSFNLQQPIFKSAKVIGTTLRSADFAKLQIWNNELAAWIREGRIQIKIKHYPFEEAMRAHQDMESRQITGRAVLTL